MKISDIELFPLSLPLVGGTAALGTDGPASADTSPEALANQRYGPPETVIVRVRTDDGASGLGEAATLGHYFNQPLGAIIDWLQRYTKALIGADPMNIIGAHRAMTGVSGFAPPGCHPARAAIDMALYDIAGKAHGCPVHELLGGAHRTRFALQTQMHGHTPAQQLAVCRHFIEKGFRALKVKVGATIRRDGYSKAAVDDEVAKVAAVIGAVPDHVAIDVDANQAFPNAKTAVGVAERLLHGRFHQNLALEQPLHHLDLAGHRYLRRTLPIPLVLDESVVSPEAVFQIARFEAADRIVLKINRVGGLWMARKVVNICEAGAIGISLDTMPFTLLGDTALCHLAATIRDPYPFDAVGHTYFRTTPFSGGIRLEDGEAVLPDSPGLGVELDEAMLRSLTIAEAG